MGNKSKMKRHNTKAKNRAGESIVVKGWTSNRKLAEARMPRTCNGSTWHGLAEKNIAPMVRLSPSGGNVRLALPVIYPSARLGTLRGRLQKRVA